MRRFLVIVACSAGLALASAMSVSAADNAAAPTASTPAASAGEWCGFQDKAGSVFRCGFSTLNQCKASVGDDKDSYCIPDPKFVEDVRAGRRLV